MSSNPTVTINGSGNHELTRREDVKKVFEAETPFAPDERIGEWVVEDIDYELDYITNSREAYVLRAHVFFESITPEGGGHIKESDLHVGGWGRVSEVITSNGVGIVYEREAH